MRASLLENSLIRDQAYALSVEAYHALAYGGHIPEKVELIDGIIIEKMTISPLHSTLVGVLIDILTPHVPEKAHIRPGMPITMDTSEPEPDIAVVSGDRADYRNEHPRTALFVIEAAVSSLDLDRKKASLYSRAGVPEYWIVDLNAMCIERYRRPANGEYAEKQTFQKDESIPLPMGRNLSVTLAEFLNDVGVTESSG